MKLLIAALAAAVLAAPAAHAEQLPPPVPAKRVFESPDLNGPRARGVKLSPDGRSVTYIKVRADDLTVTDLWIADVAGGEPRMLIDGKRLAPEARELSEAEKARRERAGVATRGVVDYEWDSQGRLILAPVEGDLYIYDLGSGQVRRLTRTPGDEIDAKVSPKGSFVSYVRDDDLYVTPAAGGAERALTQGGTELKSWGTAEFIAQEEMDRHTGYWWSPDEARIAVAHVDQTGVDIVERPEVGATGAKVVAQRYPRVGRPNAVVTLYVQDVATGARTKVDLGDDPDIYLARVDWSKDGRTLYVQRQSRDQRRLDLIAVDPATGKGRVILSETSPHWVDITDDFKPLSDGTFLWSSEKSGFRHLYLHRADGRLIRQVTKGAWPVAELRGVDEARGVAIFTANRDLPIERRLYEVSYRAPAEPRALTPAGGWWSAEVARAGGAFVGTFEAPQTPPQTALYRADGTRVRWIEENRLAEGHPFHPYAARLRTPEYGTIKAADGSPLWWSLRTPPGFDPAKKHPVIVQVYGGPGSARVTRGWQNPEDQILLDAGYILFKLDNRGTPNRSTAFKTAIDRKLGQLEVDDQIAGAQFLKTLPYVDPERIGVTGWSYGGYMTLLLLTAPDSPFKAGVAGAPVTDWTLYDTHYTERFMGTPKDNPEGYERSEVVRRLDRLPAGSLLLIHGMADDNVTFDHATRVMFDLQARGVPFETMVYPGLRHRGGWTPMNRLHRAMQTLEFFDRKLR
ncbi:dipeptidyl peptidase IV [Phenylobacterium zucineum HLK1]|uniref:Dipeptidyl peptidase IV n=1 Tax=Phenylobacterium zucineum (strain HLK1) TaxID=450851 RepID=B4RH88_PHEZH|nr:S9 family peptidase [Phenylobacterium zucineum]ACG79036.1 dipeptidyl peptidase IV [Phenylobacterium zucineum HLK1]